MQTRMDGWMDGWTDGRTDGWMHAWMDGWMDGRTRINTYVECMHACILQWTAWPWALNLETDMLALASSLLQQPGPKKFKLSKIERIHKAKKFKVPPSLSKLLRTFIASALRPSSTRALAFLRNPSLGAETMPPRPSNIGALMIRIWFWSPSCYIYNKEPPHKKNSIGNY